MKVDEMVKVSDISFTVQCRTSFVTIDGLAKVAYLPKTKNYRLSKTSTIVIVAGFLPSARRVQETS